MLRVNESITVQKPQKAVTFHAIGKSAAAQIAKYHVHIYHSVPRTQRSSTYDRFGTVDFLASETTLGSPVVLQVVAVLR